METIRTQQEGVVAFALAQLQLRHQIRARMLGQLSDPAFMAINFAGDGCTLLVVGFDGLGVAIQSGLQAIQLFFNGANVSIKLSVQIVRQLTKQLGQLYIHAISKALLKSFFLFK